MTLSEKLGRLANVSGKKDAGGAKQAPKQEQDLALEDVSTSGEVPTSTRSYVLIGFFIVVFMFGGFSAWAALAPLNSAVIAPGTVKVFSSRKKIQHLEGGIVAEVLVANGDVVQKGEVLVRLDETRAVADRRRVQTQYDQARAAVARLIAERDGADVITFPEDMLARKDSEPSVLEAINGQKKLFEARKASIDGQVSMVSERVNQLNEEIVGLQAQIEAKSEQMSLLNSELDGLRELHQKGYAPKTRILALERAGAELRGERGSHIARMAQARVQIGEAELEMLQVQKNAQEQIVAELRERQTEAFDFAETLEKAAFTLEHTEIRAPESGVVVNKQVNSTGQVIAPGEVVLELVPDDDTLIIEARVFPKDIDNVYEGLRADVQLTAFSQRTTPRLLGELTYVAADALMDERTGMPYYTANISVSEEEVARLGEDRKLQPGMLAEVYIQTGARTPFDYLVEPIQHSMSRAWRES
ncbi:MAG: HlyD family type I secretion periplasmic adaptor subunit [Alphaproteobacteria bacterium]